MGRIDTLSGSSGSTLPVGAVATAIVTFVMKVVVTVVMVVVTVVMAVVTVVVGSILLGPPG